MARTDTDAERMALATDWWECRRTIARLDTAHPPERGRFVAGRVIPRALLLLVAAACDEQSPPMDRPSAQTCLDDLAKLPAAMAALDRRGVIDGIAEMTNASLLIDTPPGAVRGGLQSLVCGTMSSGSAACTADACTFYGFGCSAEFVGAWSYTGTVTRTGDMLAVQLAYTSFNKVYAEDWSIDGSVLQSPTMVDGSIHSHGTVTPRLSEPGHIVWDVAVDYHAILLDDAGCPIAGRLRSRTSYDTSIPPATGSAPSYDADGTLAFSAPCRGP